MLDWWVHLSEIPYSAEPLPRQGHQSAFELLSLATGYTNCGGTPGVEHIPVSGPPLHWFLPVQSGDVKLLV